MTNFAEGSQRKTEVIYFSPLQPCPILFEFYKVWVIGNWDFFRCHPFVGAYFEHNFGGSQVSETVYWDISLTTQGQESPLHATTPHGELFLNMFFLVEDEMLLRNITISQLTCTVLALFGGSVTSKLWWAYGRLFSAISNSSPVVRYPVLLFDLSV